MLGVCAIISLFISILFLLEGEIILGMIFAISGITFIILKIKETQNNYKTKENFR